MEAADRDPAFDPARLPYFSEALSLNPLLAHPAAAMAAATAIGFGFASQMASAFFGVLQGAMEAANPNGLREAGASAPAEKPAGPAVSATAEPVPAAVKPKAKPVRKAAAPAAKKPAVKAAPAAAPAKAKVAPKTAAKAPPAKAPAAPAVVSRSPAKPKTSAKPAGKAAGAEGAGDLKRISGIGPKLEEVLKGMGVMSLAQVAAWTDADIARFDKELGFEGRIRRDDWVGQAKALLR